MQSGRSEWKWCNYGANECGSAVFWGVHCLQRNGRVEVVSLYLESVKGRGLVIASVYVTYQLFPGFVLRLMDQYKGSVCLRSMVYSGSECHSVRSQSADLTSVLGG